MKDIFKLGFVLLFVCMIAAFALGVTNEVTKGPIADNIAEANRQARIAVFPSASEFTLIASKDDVEDYTPHASAEKFLADYEKVSEVFIALSDSGEELGFVIRTRPNGYGGAIDVIIGFTNDGVITGVRVGDHQETPGLGAKAKTEDFYTQYDGLMADGSIVVIKETVQEGNNAIQAITSATITSQAVTDGVNLTKAVLDTFK